MSPEERDLLQKAADEEGRTLSSLARHLISQGLQSLAGPPGPGGTKNAG